jgi:hypothetical protein
VTWNKWLIIVGSAAILAVTALIVIPVLSASNDPSVSVRCDTEGMERTVVARVGDEVLIEEELRFAGLDSSYVCAWADDELLAQLAIENSLENPRLSRYVEKRARQVYLRDLMLEQIVSEVRTPTREEVEELMRSDSLLYMVERHYFHILLADSMLADSIRNMLARGETFQTTAQRLSIGQKAGIGGDLGFLVGGELVGSGLPQSAGLLDGLSGVYSSSLGWHILMVTETRELEDTLRVTTSLTEIFQRRLENERIDSVLTHSRERIEYMIDETWR